MIPYTRVHALQLRISQQVETHCSNQTYTLRHRGDPYQACIGNSRHLQVCGVGIV